MVGNPFPSIVQFPTSPDCIVIDFDPTTENYNPLLTKESKESEEQYLRPIFTSSKDKLPIFKQSNLIYRFTCRCNSTYIGLTCQRLEVRVRQHIPRSLLSGQLTSGHSQAMDSAIGEHLLIINSCRTSYEDDCFSGLHRGRNKFHLKFQEAIYISMNRPSLCRQLNNHILNIFGVT